MYVDDIKLARKKQNINPTWKILMKDVDLGEPTSFIDHVYLGCTQPECQRSKDIVDNYRSMWNWQWPSLDYRQRDHRRAREAQGQVHHWTTRNWNPRECDSQPINTCEIRGRVADQHESHLSQGMSPKRFSSKTSTPKRSSLKTSSPEELSLTNLRTGPYQIHERFVRSSLAGDMEEFRKVGADVSYFQSQMHFDYDTTESIADSDLEDGEPTKKMLASPLYLQNREDYESSRMPIATEKPAALLQERGAGAKSAQADLRTGLMSSSSQEPSALGKLAALFSFGSEEPGDQFKSSVFRNADPSNVFLEGNKDHLLSQARSELMKQEHQVGSLQAYAQGLVLLDAHHEFFESRREQTQLQEKLSIRPVLFAKKPVIVVFDSRFY